MEELTREQAIALVETRWWVGKPDREVAEFQLHVKRLCMPFGEFHDAVERALGRAVFTHEFADAERLRAELRGDRPAPSFLEIVEMIPEAKRIIVEVP